MTKKAIIAGASGLIGNTLLNTLLNAPEYSEVLILVRKEIPFQHPKLKQLVLNFDKLNEHADQVHGDALFCCLGTTKKKTPDQNEYYKIDHDYPVQLGNIAKKNKISQYHLISSAGANARSSVFYTRTKGEAENDLKNLNLNALFIYRPSLLTGERKEKRFMEKIFIKLFEFLNPLFIGRLKKLRSISAQTVANALYKNSLKNKSGTYIYASNQIHEFSLPISLVS